MGNWAGVTVEKSEVFFKFKNQDFHIIDLPGIYDLNATTDAERVAVDSLKGDTLDVVVGQWHGDLAHPSAHEAVSALAP